MKPGTFARTRNRSPSFFMGLGLFGLALAVGGFRAEFSDFNPPYEGPIHCPMNLPTGKGTWQPLPHPIQKSGGGGSVSFVPNAFTHAAPFPGPLGHSWYIPNDGTIQEESGTLWLWSNPKAEFECEQIRISHTTYARFYTPTFNDQGTAVEVFQGTGGGGGGEGQENCYIAFYWWIDHNGTYHEQPIYSWCEPEWEV